MTIRRGEPWGEPAARPPGLVVARTDAELAALVAADPGGRYGVSGGDLHRAIGAPGPREQMQRLPVDAIAVDLDGTDRLAVAHVVARSSWWRGPIVATMNCDHLGTWDVAPRAHPNDGRLDVVEVDTSMTLRNRLQARRRLPHGTHVPHPSIAVRTTTEASWTFARPTPVVIDGVPAGRVRRLTVRAQPDHFAIYA